MPARFSGPCLADFQADLKPVITISTPFPRTVPHPLPGSWLSAPRLDAEVLHKGLLVLAGRQNVCTLVVFGSGACAGPCPQFELDLLLYGQQGTAWLSSYLFPVLMAAVMAG